MCRALALVLYVLSLSLEWYTRVGGSEVLVCAQCYLISMCMYLLNINYDDSVTDFIADINTFSFATDLLLRGIYTEQSDSCTLVFDSERERMYATLAYTGTGVLECI